MALIYRSKHREALGRLTVNNAMLPVVLPFLHSAQYSFDIAFTILNARQLLSYKVELVEFVAGPRSQLPKTAANTAQFTTSQGIPNEPDQ